MSTQTAAETVVAPGIETLDFDGLRIAFDDRVLRPRPWTAAQSAWAEDLLRELPEGPVLELCAGAGHIGLRAVRDTDRALVCVDADPVAVAFAGANALAAGMARRVEVREGRLEHALRADERFPLVIADPPWVRRDDIGTYPEDPVTAIDGGDDGLDVARSCLRVAAGHLVPGGAVLLQLGTTAQAQALSTEIGHGVLVPGEVREHPRGVVLRLDRPAA